MENFVIDRKEIVEKIKKDLLQKRANANIQDKKFIVPNQEDDEFSHYEILAKIIDAYRRVLANGYYNQSKTREKANILQKEVIGEIENDRR